jgi:His-Xaa-Ser system protein HxsD
MSSALDDRIMRFEAATTSLDVLQRALYAMADVVTADIAVAPGAYVCTLFPRSERHDIEELRHRVRDEVLDHTLRARIAAQTEPIRNLVFALAFSRTGLLDDELPRE